MATEQKTIIVSFVAFQIRCIWEVILRIGPLNVFQCLVNKTEWGVGGVGVGRQKKKTPLENSVQS